MLSMSDKSVHTSDKIIPLVYFILDSSLKTEIFSTGPCGQTTHFLHSLFPGMELAFSLPFTVNLSLFSFYRVPRWYSIKDSACQCRRCKRCRFNPWVGKIPLEQEMAAHSSILAWKIPWAEEPDRSQGVTKNQTRLINEQKSYSINRNQKSILFPDVRVLKSLFPWEGYFQIQG